MKEFDQTEEDLMDNSFDEEDMQEGSSVSDQMNNYTDIIKYI